VGWGAVVMWLGSERTDEEVVALNRELECVGLAVEQQRLAPLTPAQVWKPQHGVCHGVGLGRRGRSKGWDSDCGEGVLGWSPEWVDDRGARLREGRIGVQTTREVIYNLAHCTRRISGVIH